MMITSKEIDGYLYIKASDHMASLLNAIDKTREECAKIADEWAVAYPHPSKVIAEKIRKQTEQIRGQV